MNEQSVDNFEVPAEQKNIRLRQDVVRSVAGPMASSLASIEEYTEAATTKGKPWTFNAHVTPVPWRKELATIDRPLRIGYIIDDGVVKVQPPAARAVREVVERLKAAGHEGACFVIRAAQAVFVKGSPFPGFAA